MGHSQFNAAQVGDEQSWSVFVVSRLRCIGKQVKEQLQLKKQLSFMIGSAEVWGKYFSDNAFPISTFNTHNIAENQLILVRNEICIIVWSLHWFVTNKVEIYTFN